MLLLYSNIKSNYTYYSMYNHYQHISSIPRDQLLNLLPPSLPPSLLCHPSPSSSSCGIGMLELRHISHRLKIPNVTLAIPRPHPIDVELRHPAAMHSSSPSNTPCSTSCHDRRLISGHPRHAILVPAKTEKKTLMNRHAPSTNVNFASAKSTRQWPRLSGFKLHDASSLPLSVIFGEESIELQPLMMLRQHSSHSTQPDASFYGSGGDVTASSAFIH